MVECDGEVTAWASAPPYRTRPAYAGVGEFSVYVARAHRRRGHGRAALAALLGECEARGMWKLVSRIFPENEGSLALCRELGFREVADGPSLRERMRLAGCGTRRPAAQPSGAAFGFRPALDPRFVNQAIAR